MPTARHHIYPFGYDHGSSSSITTTTSGPVTLELRLDDGVAVSEAAFDERSHSLAFVKRSEPLQMMDCNAVAYRSANAGPESRAGEDIYEHLLTNLSSFTPWPDSILSSTVWRQKAWERYGLTLWTCKERLPLWIVAGICESRHDPS